MTLKPKRGRGRPRKPKDAGKIKKRKGRPVKYSLGTKKLFEEEIDYDLQDLSKPPKL